MTTYSGQLLRVDQVTLETSSTFLLVTDTDSTMSSQDSGATYNLCGLNMASPPVIDLRQITGTLLDGTAFSYTVGHFTARGKDFYILPAALAPEAVAAVTSSTPLGPLVPFDYFSHGQTAEYAQFLAGQALSVRFDTAGQAVATAVVGAVVTDDDGLVQFDGQSGGTVTETGGPASIMFGPDFDTPLDFNTFDRGDRQMVLVRVFYHGASADGSFVALRVSQTTAEGTHAFYIPRNGGPDLSDILSYTRERLLKTSVEGMAYAAFGLDGDRDLQSGTGGDDFLQGTIQHDEVLALGGSDRAVGGMGEDLLDGGLGNDNLFGGAQNDTLIGGVGNDSLYGDNDDDSMIGGAGSDSLIGNWGHDSLFGGDGNDKLGAGSDGDLVSGGAGNDSLIGFDGDDVLMDGTGFDTLIGGKDADTFVLVVDGATDRIVDFQDGLDRIGLDASFASLTITSLSAGHVQILHAGEVLLIDDPTGQLTAADLTAADFL